MRGIDLHAKKRGQSRFKLVECLGINHKLVETVPVSYSSWKKGFLPIVWLAADGPVPLVVAPRSRVLGVQEPRERDGG